ncbi:aldose epimerase family protein [Defluviimonas sp. WL0075]|uniref:Aldose 1-epimerase n=1 Tax=Albidovulum sediminicola TaxID=2984331 RepID=A0ABT2Z1P0_9RHOB|nr:aldose epimerase family protein [Defluviimonas sp. WL0075]MCV2865052.1 galactose mutarotase [Defluviimonas sp. WL0075]
MSMTERLATLPDGSPVERAVLHGGGLSASVLSFGAILQDLRLEGHSPPLVLGFARIEDYLAYSPYFGAIAGRCANRIAGAAFTLDGVTHQLDANFLGKHQLHGGKLGTSHRLWSFEEVGTSHATLTLLLPDGDMGYPGALTARVRFTLEPGGVLDIRITATTDRPTLCNLAHHSYFNLSGEADILNHQLRLAADHYLPVDAELIPSGQVASVAGTRFDFRTPQRLGDACARGPIDHNLCLAPARGPLREVGELRGGDLSMRIRTTEPGLQVFDGAPLAVPVPGLDGRAMGAFPGIALEPQVWPDAIHHPDWPQPVLRPEEIYEQHTQFVFARVAAPGS